MKLWSKDFIFVNVINIFYGFGFSMMLPLIPLYVAFKGGTDPDVGLVSAAFAASAILMRFATPPLLGRLSRTLLLRAAVLLSIAVTASLAAMSSVPGILLVRVLQGVGFGIVSTVCSVLAVDLLPAARRGEGIGYFGMGNVLMAAISPAVGLWLVDAHGFGAAFFAAAAGQLLSIVALAFFRPDRCLVQPAAGERRKPPFLSRIYDRALALQTVLLVLFGMIRCAEMNFLPLLATAQGIPHLSTFYIVQTATSFAVRFLAGNIYDRKGHAWIIIPGCIGFLVSLLLIARADGLGVLLAAGVFNGAALGALQPCMQTWAVSSVQPERRDIASAVFFNFYDIGIMAGSILLGNIAAAFGYPAVYLFTCIPAGLFLGVYVVSRAAGAQR
ncbi:MAG: MFS transporter [Clostridiales Family XIII bacterium]|nr:MFS transporter [Clostridiales Family XIII bacterium]